MLQSSFNTHKTESVKTSIWGFAGGYVSDYFLAGTPAGHPHRVTYPDTDCRLKKDHSGDTSLYYCQQIPWNDPNFYKHQLQIVSLPVFMDQHPTLPSIQMHDGIRSTPPHPETDEAGGNVKRKTWDLGKNYIKFIFR